MHADVKAARAVAGQGKRAGYGIKMKKQEEIG